MIKWKGYSHGESSWEPLQRKSLQVTKMKTNRGAPGVRHHDSSFRDEVPVVCIVLAGYVRNGFKVVSISRLSGRNRQLCVPTGPTVNHLDSSFTTACTYGSRGRSATVGRRSLPTTLSSSACAERWHSGWFARAANNACEEATV